MSVYLAGGASGHTNGLTALQSDQAHPTLGAVPVPDSQPPAQAPSATTPASEPSEGAWIGRLVALATPILAVAGGALAGWVAKEIPGAHLDPAEITAFMVSALVAVLGAGLHWLGGWQQHERLVAEGRATPVVSARTRQPIISRRGRVEPGVVAPSPPIPQQPSLAPVAGPSS